MARKQPTPASQSNTGMIVALVFFVLTTITLGVFVYFGYDGQRELRDAEKKKSGELAKANQELATQRERYKALSLAVTPGEDANPTALAEDESKKEAAFKAEMDGLDAAKKEAGGESAAAAPAGGPGSADGARFITAKIEELRNRLTQETKAHVDTLKRAAKADKDLAAAQKAFTDRIAAANKATEESQANAVKDLTKEREEYLKKMSYFDSDVSKPFAKTKQELEDARSEANRAKQAADDRERSLKAQLEKAHSKIELPNSLTTDLPKGRILRVDRGVAGSGTDPATGVSTGGTTTVFIDLGSADFLRPQVTFSVYPANTTGKIAATSERKASIEVVKILEPHLALARVTQLANELSNPLLKGDLLFNPTWNSGQRDHVALSGIFDLDGDGSDDTPEVVRNLERQGIVVDAWLDLKTRKVVGKGINEQTSYLILGEQPRLSEAMQRQVAQLGENPISTAIKEINILIGTMQEDAKMKGVQPLQYRRYLSFVGYQLPKVTREVDASSTTYLRQSTSGAPATPPSPPATDTPEKPK